MHIGTHGSLRRHVESKDPSVGVERQPAMHERVARLGVRYECLGPRRRPPDRPSEQACGVEEDGELRIGSAPDTERTADILRRDHQRMLVDAKHPRDLVAYLSDALIAGMKTERVRRRIVRGHRGAGLHRTNDDALARSPHLDHVRCARECGCDTGLVAKRPLEGDIAWRRRPKLRRSGCQRVLDARDGL